MTRTVSTTTAVEITTAPSVAVAPGFSVTSDVPVTAVFSFVGMSAPDSLATPLPSLPETNEPSPSDFSFVNENFPQTPPRRRMSIQQLSGLLAPDESTSSSAISGTMSSRSRSCRDLLVLSISFFLLFVAFNASQSYLTSLHPRVGHLSLGVLYIVWSLSNLFVAPVVIRRIGPKAAIWLGAVPYVFFAMVTGLPTISISSESIGSRHSLHRFKNNDTSQLGVLLRVNQIIIVVSGALNGFSASLLWGSHGVILTRAAAGQMGMFSGIFWSFFQLSLIVGYLLTGLLSNVLKLPMVYVFVCYGWIALVGAFVFWGLRDIPVAIAAPPDDLLPTTHNGVNEEPQNGFNCQLFAKRLCSSLIVVFDLRFLLLCPTFASNGFCYGFYFGTMTERAGTKSLAWTFTGFALAEFFGSLVFGRLTEFFGKRKMMWITFIVVATALGYTFSLSLPHLVFFYVNVTFCGLADAGYNTLIYSAVGTYYEANAAAAFSSLKFVQSVSIAAQFFTEKSLSFFATQICLCVLLVLAMVSFFFLDFFVSPVDRYSPNETEDCGDTNCILSFLKCCSSQKKEEKSETENKI